MLFKVLLTELLELCKIFFNYSNFEYHFLNYRPLFSEELEPLSCLFYSNKN